MWRTVLQISMVAALLVIGTPLLTSMDVASSEAIARAITDLGDDRFSVREKASEFLWKAGRPAEKLLKAAAASSDAEVARRARAILDRFKWGIYHDTPSELIEVIDQYRGGDARVRRQVVRDLLRKGRPFHYLLLKFAQTEDDPSIRDGFWDGIANELPTLVRPAIEDGKLDLAEEMLEFGIQNQDPRLIRDYVALMYLCGCLERKIAELRPLLDKQGIHDQARLLAYLFRAQGDLGSAIRAAERSGDDDFVTSLLLEQGNWQALADRIETQTGVGHLNTDDVQLAGFRLAFHRLSGNRAKADEAAQAIGLLAKTILPLEPDYAWPLAKALLVNERPSEALAILTEYKQIPEAMELLIAQLRFAEAFALADKADTPALKLRTHVAKGRGLYLVGEKDQAIALFKEVAATAAGDNTEDFTPITELLDAERKLGLRELLYDHASKALGSRNQSLVLATVFPERSQDAEVWFDLLSRHKPALAPAARLGKVAALLEGKLPPAELAALAKEAEEFAKKLGPDRRQVWLVTLAEALHSAQQHAEAERHLRNAIAAGGPSTAAQRLGDLLADNQRWAEAAEEYRRAWEQDRSQVRFLYLRGHALAQAGDQTLGQKLIDLSRVLPLSNEVERTARAEALVKRQRRVDARQERELITRLGEFDWELLPEARRQLAIDAMPRQDHQAVADGLEQYWLACLRLEHQTDFYFAFPQWIHKHRALAQVAGGKLDDAVRAARLATGFFPQDVDVATELCAALTKAGRQADADALYGQVRRTLVDVCKAHPKCATHRNSLAWLMACNKRDLDEALARALEAVTFEPATPAYLDTLAEIHFQRGEQDKAIDRIKQCIQLDAKKVYYKEQLKRFEAGDRQAPIPQAPIPKEDAD